MLDNSPCPRAGCDWGETLLPPHHSVSSWSLSQAGRRLTSNDAESLRKPSSEAPIAALHSGTETHPECPCRLDRELDRTERRHDCLLHISVPAPSTVGFSLRASLGLPPTQQSSWDVRGQGTASRPWGFMPLDSRDVLSGGWTTGRTLGAVL